MPCGQFRPPGQLRRIPIVAIDTANDVPNVAGSVVGAFGTAVSRSVAYVFATAVPRTASTAGVANSADTARRRCGHRPWAFRAGHRSPCHTCCPCAADFTPAAQSSPAAQMQQQPADRRHGKKAQSQRTRLDVRQYFFGEPQRQRAGEQLKPRLPLVRRRRCRRPAIRSSSLRISF